MSGTARLRTISKCNNSPEENSSENSPENENVKGFLTCNPDYGAPSPDPSITLDYTADPSPLLFANPFIYTIKFEAA